ncbi:MAG TPA: DUF2855 family protein [Rubrivivax sp.]|nr:DUF2855 family protein [Rubrivivax sp.]HRY89181.1 DUF2855 family protein [Rubrivivax sp.]
MPTITRLVTDKRSLGRTELRRDDAPASLDDGEVLIRLELFALSTNNITYAAFGDSMGYWRFFPTGDDAVGHMPVWGYGCVAESRCGGIAPGERFFGYFPIASHLRLRPTRVKERGFLDDAPNRRSLPRSYNYYERVSANPSFTAAPEDLVALFRPLYPTSFLLADYLADNRFFGAQRLLLSSASSKTAYGAAFYLRQMAPVPLIGLTSAVNRAFVESLGCWDQVLGYDEIGQLDTGAPVTYVDFSSDPGLRRRIHRHFGAALMHDCWAGSTGSHDFLDANAHADLPGPKPTMHVAFDQILQRNRDWGPEEVARRLAQAQASLLDRVAKADPPWVRIERADGFAGAAAVIGRMAAGRIDPALGFVVHL